MPWFRTFLWIGTIFLMIVLGAKSFSLKSKQVSTVEAFEMASRSEAVAMLQSWKDVSVTHIVVTSIKLDYLFVAFYVLLMLNCSSHQMNKERNLILNNLLRFNIALSIVTGILDIVENVIMMHNINSIDEFFPTVVISILKFAFAGWIIIVWLVSVGKGALSRKAYA